ncbi:arylsulfotransferase family protein [uncultured Eudoraea sp.]|uniref:arylsulfotransferase family protein n=1 Tax=uncultured Eudoraea sp. TaxID=1035614 RepID=UPI0026047A62|nr:arylsulfotransferase family protein [uncultured Eudoraea sp.]
MKKLRYIFIAIVGILIFSTLLASSIRNIYGSKDGGYGRFGILVKPLKFMAEIPSTVKKVFSPAEFYVTNSTSKEGLTFNKNFELKEYPNLLVSYKEKEFDQKFDLIDLNNGSLIKRWEPNNKTLYEQAYNLNNPRKPSKGSDLYFMHPLILEDSTLIFSAQLTSLLAKIDKNSQLIWLKNDRTYHHTLELDINGNIYTCTTPFQSKKYNFLSDNYDIYKNNIIDDHITLIDKNNGNELFDKSIIDILLENGYEDLLLAKGQINSDPVHLNDIQPALYSTDHWLEGDLLISCRNLSAVFLYRPSTNKILWLKSGPWYNQHDVDFLDDDKVLVFGNDVIREESIIDPRLTTSNLFFSSERPHNNAYVYHLSNDSISTPYTDLFQTEEIHTYTSGRCDILPNGDIFIEDTNHGRIIIGNSTTKKIEYVKRLDKDHISSLFWSRIVN